MRSAPYLGATVGSLWMVQSLLLVTLSMAWATLKVNVRQEFVSHKASPK